MSHGAIHPLETLFVDLPGCCGVVHGRVKSLRAGLVRGYPKHPRSFSRCGHGSARVTNPIV